MPRDVAGAPPGAVGAGGGPAQTGGDTRLHAATALVLSLAVGVCQGRPEGSSGTTQCTAASGA